MYANIRIQARRRADVVAQVRALPTEMLDVDDVIAFGAIVLFGVTLLLYAAVISGLL